ncbi:hypothetical protein [Mesonia sp. K7]|uniref:hypothetical protein n=1 Tax=Mesonia sp. K7 TaxID=2218606 RepID=UPI0011B58D54|nr:hypothetical protein [Mesonia sp. K7]
MKRNFLLFIIILFMYNCKTTTRTTKAEYNFLRDHFKFTYFQDCLKHGFNKSDEIMKILVEDKSYRSDFILGMQNYKYIDSLAKLTAKAIKKDSIKSLTTAHESAQGKKVFKKCLCDYNSKWLDSIATSRLK